MAQVGPALPSLQLPLSLHLPSDAANMAGADRGGAGLDRLQQVGGRACLPLLHCTLG